MLNETHAAASLLKVFFRMMPVALFTFELYGEFIDVIKPVMQVSKEEIAVCFGCFTGCHNRCSRLSQIGWSPRCISWYIVCLPFTLGY